MASLLMMIKDSMSFVIEKEITFISYFWNRGIHWSDLIYLLALEVLVLYIYLKWEQGYFRRRSIKNLPFSVPFVGHFFKTMAAREHVKDMVLRHYQAFPGEKYTGIRQLNQSLILIKDLELVKRLTIKDFDHFTDHQLALDEKTDSIFGNHLFALKGEKWRDMRGTLSPAFTSSKMKNMFQFIAEISEQLVDYLKEKMEEPEFKERGLLEVDMKDIFGRFSNDVIASSAFGVKIDSLKQPENKFYEMAKSVLDFSVFESIKAFIGITFPILLRWRLISIFDDKLKNFFRSMVLSEMKMREEKNIVRPDMIHLLREARKGTLKYEASQNENTETGFATVEESHIGKRVVKRNWSDDDIVAQAVIFFFGGFDSISTMLSFMAVELAANEKIQKRLQEEVDDVIAKKENKKLEYGDLADLKYLDMVVSETLRMWPSLAFTDRNCVKPYKLPPSSGNGEGYTMQVGEGLMIPVYAFHHDPKYFPNPEKFNPERFSDENKHKIVPMSYLPFGIGPRNCIGNRFALMEAKAVMFYLMANFDFVQTAKSDYPVQLKKGMFNFIPSHGYWIGIKPRN